LLAATLAFTGNGEMAFAAEPPKVTGDGDHVCSPDPRKAKQARKLPRPCFAEAVCRSARTRKRNRVRCALKLSRVKWKHYWSQKVSRSSNAARKTHEPGFTKGQSASFAALRHCKARPPSQSTPARTPKARAQAHAHCFAGLE